MGCDIHIFKEQKVGNKWVMVEELGSPADDRIYSRFAALAGVRGNGAPPKGLPDDISDSVKLHVDKWGSDGHSHSYMGVNEAAPIFLNTDMNSDEYAEKYPLSRYFNIDDESYVCKCCNQPLPENKYRLVFFFDN